MLGVTLSAAATPMGVLDFIASMTGSLAWPVAAFAIALLFRGQLRGLLERLNEIGFGDAKAKFDRELDAAEKKAETLPPPPEQVPLPNGATAPDEADTEETVNADEQVAPEEEPTEDDEDAIALAHRKAVLRRYSQYGVESGRFAALLDISPSAAILDTYRIVERSLYRVAELKGLNLPLNRMTVRTLAYELAKAKLIPSDVAQLIAQLQEMRNRAAHGVEPTVIDAIRFRDISTRVAAALREAAR